MKKLIYCLIAVILLIAAILGILYLSSGFSTRTDVGLLDISYNSAEETLTLNTTLFSSMGFIRKATVKHNGEKIYVSAHSAEESIAAYIKYGCVFAEEPDPAHIENEPFDLQLEYDLSSLL